jgi:hypothetical protein
MLGGSWCFSPGERKAEKGRWINCRKIKKNALYMTYKTRKWRNGVRNWRGEIKETCRERRKKIWKKAEAERKN